jgi:hypothetical protein
VRYRFLDSFSELCGVRNADLEGLYLGRWYRAAVTGVDGAGVHLVYLESEDTEVLRPRAGKSFPYWPLACTGLRILSRILSLILLRYRIFSSNLEYFTERHSKFEETVSL